LWNEVVLTVDSVAPTDTTPFERWTACAFLAFSRQRVGVAVIEVGVGGGGDATNALPPPLLALITPIAMDHVDLLGPSLEDIAGHKAGIIKSGGSGAITAPGQDAAVLRVLKKRAVTERVTFLEAPALNWVRRGILSVPGVFSGDKGIELPCGLRGAFQSQNASLAWAALARCAETKWPSLTPEVIARAWESVQWRGRAEVLDVLSPLPSLFPSPLNIFLDGGHNAHAMSAVGEELAFFAQESHKKCCLPETLKGALIFSCGSTRNAEENLSLLLSGFFNALPASLSPTVLTVLTVPFSKPAGMPWVEAHPPEALGKVVKEVLQQLSPSSPHPHSVIPCDSLRQGLEKTLGIGVHFTAVCGSLYLVSDVYRDFVRTTEINVVKNM